MSNEITQPKVLKSSSFAASFSDRPQFISPQTPPPTKPTEKTVTQDIPGVIKLAVSFSIRTQKGI